MLLRTWPAGDKVLGEDGLGEVLQVHLQAHLQGHLQGLLQGCLLQVRVAGRRSPAIDQMCAADRIGGPTGPLQIAKVVPVHHLAQRIAET